MFAVRAARLFDGVSAAVADRPLVLIEDGQIRDVANGPVVPPDGVDTVELGDVTLLPGLVDCHVHLGFDAGLDIVGRMSAEDDAALVLRMRLSAQRALAAGVTTVRDLGDRGFLGLALLTGVVRPRRGHRPVGCGLGATTDGHGRALPLPGWGGGWRGGGTPRSAAEAAAC